MSGSLKGDVMKIIKIDRREANKGREGQRS